MNITKHWLVAGVATLLVSSVGCSQATSPDDDSDITADTAHPLSGTYIAVGAAAEALGYSSYTFASSGKYTATCKADAGCTGTKASGTYKVSTAKANGTMTAEIVLTTDSKPTTYAVEYDGNTLTLDATSDTPAMFFNESWSKKIPIGDVCQDDAGTSLGDCDDDGNFGCSPGIDPDVWTCNPLD
jgi:hypothetical protein